MRTHGATPLGAKAKARRVRCRWCVDALRQETLRAEAATDTPRVVWFAQRSVLPTPNRSCLAAFSVAVSNRRPFNAACGTSFDG